MALSRVARILAHLVLAVALAGCSRSPTSSAPAEMKAAAPSPAGAASPAKSGEATADEKGGPKTWKRAGSATHAARVTIGDREQLPVIGTQLNVRIDGFRARVVLDIYFENDRSSQYEGNFQLRLPDEATPYYLAFGETKWQRQQEPEFQQAAFFPREQARKMGTAPEQILVARTATWRAPKSARIVPREQAAFAFTETVRGRVDPALLEWAGAGVFNARVFPIAPKRVHRVVVGYDVNLTRAGNDFEYRLDIPEKVPRVVVDVSSSSQPLVEPEAGVETDAKGGDARRHVHLENPKDRSYTFRFANAGNPLIVGNDSKLAGQQRFAANAVVELPKTAAASEARAIFALDTSLSSNPDRFNVFLKLLSATLTNNRTTLKQFNVLFFNIETRWWKNEWVDNTQENLDGLLREANDLVLEGATDVGQALATSAEPAWAAKDTGTWDTFLLSDGAATWGASDRNLIASALVRARRGALFAYNTGLSGTDTTALSHVTRETGGALFSVVGDDEVKKASTAHKLRPFKIVSVSAPGAEDVLVAGRPRYVYPGQALFIVGRGAPKQGITLTVEDPTKATRAVKLKLAPARESELASRAYGHVAVSTLEEMGKATQTISKAYAIHHSVAGETCSLLMLESEADYARFDIKPEHEADVVTQVLASTSVERAEAALRGSLGDPKAYVQRWLDDLRDKPGVKVSPSSELLQAVATMPRESFVVRPRALDVRARAKSAVPKVLLHKLSKPGSLEYDELSREADARRAKLGPADALKALSSLVEQSPGDGILARDVGFSAMQLGLPEHAYFLFRRVADARPWEPQSYKGMADVLAKMGMTDLAIVYYEVSVQGAWDARFGEFHRIAAIDYVRFLRRIEKGQLKTSAPEFARTRLAKLREEVKLEGADLVVMITWNTDNSDVDLHVIEPTGEECMYSHRNTKMGGELTLDVTQGYGPEMYVLKHAKGGAYRVFAHYFAQQRNRASARTKVYAEVIEGWGTPQERVTEKTVTLVEGKAQHDILAIKR